MALNPGETMLIDLIEHAKAFLESIPAEVHQHILAFAESARAEEERIAAEVAHLKAKGLQVLKNGVQL
jgi:hypothetical protein